MWVEAWWWFFGLGRGAWGVAKSVGGRSVDSTVAWVLSLRYQSV